MKLKMFLTHRARAKPIINAFVLRSILAIFFIFLSAPIQSAKNRMVSVDQRIHDYRPQNRASNSKLKKRKNSQKRRGKSLLSYCYKAGAVVILSVAFYLLYRVYYRSDKDDEAVVYQGAMHQNDTDKDENKHHCPEPWVARLLSYRDTSPDGPEQDSQKREQKERSHRLLWTKIICAIDKGTDLAFSDEEKKLLSEELDAFDRFVEAWRKTGVFPSTKSATTEFKNCLAAFRRARAELNLTSLQEFLRAFPWIHFLGLKAMLGHRGDSFNGLSYTNSYLRYSLQNIDIKKAAPCFSNFMPLEEFRKGDDKRQYHHFIVSCFSIFDPLTLKIIQKRKTGFVFGKHICETIAQMESRQAAWGAALTSTDLGHKDDIRDFLSEKGLLAEYGEPFLLGTASIATVAKAGDLVIKKSNWQEEDIPGDYTINDRLCSLSEEMKGHLGLSASDIQASAKRDDAIDQKKFKAFVVATKGETHMDRERTNITHINQAYDYLPVSNFIKTVQLHRKDNILEGAEKDRYLLLQEASGITLQELLTQMKDGKYKSCDELNRIKRTIKKLIACSLHHILYGDNPYYVTDCHPGNIVIDLENERCTLIDMGQIGRLDRIYDKHKEASPSWENPPTLRVIIRTLMEQFMTIPEGRNKGEIKRALSAVFLEDSECFIKQSSGHLCQNRREGHYIIENRILRDFDGLSFQEYLWRICDLLNRVTLPIGFLEVISAISYMNRLTYSLIALAGEDRNDLFFPTLAEVKNPDLIT